MALTWEQHQKNIFGGESGGDYDALFGYQNRPDGAFAGIKVSQMPVGDVIKFTSPSGKYGEYVKSQVGRIATPVGAYQVVGTTLRDAVKALGIDPNQKFDKATQDKIGQYILKTQGTDAWEGYGKGGASMQNKPAQMAQSQQPQQQSQGLLGGILGGQGIGGALGLSDDFRDKLRMGILAGSDPRAFAQQIAAAQQAISSRASERRKQAGRNSTADYLERIGQTDAANLLRQGAISAADALSFGAEKRTAAMKEYELAKSDPEFADFLKLKEVPETPAGLKKLDEQFATTLSPNAAQALSVARQDAATISSVLKKLEAGENITGPLVGAIPEKFRAIINPESVQAQQLVESVVQKNLRAILGGQFAQKEGEQLVNRAYNPLLPPEQNAARLRALFLSLDAAASNKQAMQDYFFNNNYSLKGYKGPMGVPTMAEFEQAMDNAATPPDQKNTTDAPKSFPKAPPIGTISKGYRYKGGDPSNKSNWEPVE